MMFFPKIDWKKQKKPCKSHVNPFSVRETLHETHDGAIAWYQVGQRPMLWASSKWWTDGVTPHGINHEVKGHL